MHAIICFMVGGASSYYLAQFFPFITKGTLPLITGYLAMGVVVGPYVTNMVTTYHIFLLSSVINKFALSFIAAAAGSEIFFPELRGVIWPIICQLFFIFVMNFAVLVPGIHYLTPYLHFISAEPKECQLAIIFLIATIMLARSPASAVALIQEAKATGPSAKVMLGITVMSDLVVLIAFAIVTAGVRVVCAEPGKQAKHIDWLGVTWILSEIGASVAIGLCLGLILLFILWVPIRRYAVQTQYFTIQIYRSQVKALFILPICFSAFIVSDHFYRFSSRHMARGLKLEPLIVLIVAACLAGHDRRNRHKFANILDKAAPAVFLPFFVLTGASLQLEALHYVMGVALAISGLRILGILLGSSLGGCFQISCSMNTDYSEVKYMWTTLIAQAGVALGLALEVQSSFPSWGRPFTTLILAIVVISQIIGPVACKFGLYQMQQAEVFQQQHEWRQSRPIAGIKTVGQEPDLDIYRMGSSAVLRSLSTRMSQFVNREPAPGDNQPRDASFSPARVPGRR